MCQYTNKPKTHARLLKFTDSIRFLFFWLVGAAVRLHKKLSYFNEHQKCQLNSYKQGLESKQRELASLKILVENLKASRRTVEDNGRISEQNEKELRMVSSTSGLQQCTVLSIPGLKLVIIFCS